jgi:peptidoglycan/LPS O-acetylase OafA/YrhL
VLSLSLRAISRPASAHLDLIRGVAACAVMWGHLRTLFFVEYQRVANPSAPLKAIYFLTGFGHQAVVAFFVLSGFLISFSMFNSLAAEKWSWSEYAIHRSARLYVVLIPGLLLGLLWDFLGSHFFDSSALYSQPLSDLGPAIARNNLTAGTFVGNLFFLQTIVCPAFGSNGPLWSLANEFWYYVLFPLILFAGLAWIKRSLWPAIALSALAGGVVYFLGTEKVIGFLVWMAGCVLVIMYCRFSLKPRAGLIVYLVASSLALAVWLIAARTGTLAPLGSDLFGGCAFALFLFGILQLSYGAHSDYYLRGTHAFAGFSYSLYVLHFPFVLFLRASITQWQRWQPDVIHLLYFAMLGAVTLAFAWAVALFTESKTQVARNWIRTAVRVSGSGDKSCFQNRS